MRHLSMAYAEEPSPVEPEEPGAARARASGGSRTGGGFFTVESERRLSQSILWQAQRRYFHERGIDAWRTATVPHYVTNNPALAHAYAEVVLGFLRDQGAGRPGGEPIHIVEIGAGSGRFGYLLLRALLDLKRRSPLADARIRYVMTDFTETNLAFLRGHEALAPLVAEGVLDFALFDAEGSAGIELDHAGTTLGQGSAPAPLVVIANYVLDGLPQDAFTVRGGRLHECLVSLRSERPEPDPGDPSLFARLTLDLGRRPAPADYYPEAVFNDILAGYARDLDEATILFPSVALRCLSRLAGLTGGPLLVLSGDKGTSRAQELRAPDALRLDIHGSFSMMVNYHAVGEWARRRGGEAMFATKGHAHLCIAGFLLGEGGGRRETRFAFEQSIDRAGPDDFFTVRRGLQPHYQDLEIEHLVSLLRLSHHDPKIFRDCLPALREKIGDADGPIERDLRDALLGVAANYYHIGEEVDLPFALGALLHEIGASADALALFQRSARLYGDDPATRWNMGVCHYELGELDEALACFAGASALDPGRRALPAIVRKGGSVG